MYNMTKIETRMNCSSFVHIHDIQFALHQFVIFYKYSAVNSAPTYRDILYCRGWRKRYRIMGAPVWIDFENNTITIRHTVTSCRIDGKKVMVAADRTKNKSSMRTLPLVPFFKERLLYLQDQQNKHRRLCGRSYCREYIGYICVDEIGVLIKPDYISAAFPKLLDSHGLRRIRFHDLRHSCASLLLAHGVPMKQIQEWLGHSDFSTTANIYTHLDYATKLSSAETLVNSLDFAPEPKPLPG